MKRKRLLVLVAQPPDVDPRIDWVATMAAAELDVTVLALDLPQLGRAPFEHDTPYRVVTLPRHPGLRSSAVFAFALMSALPRRHLLLGAFLGLAASVPLAACGLLWFVYKRARSNRLLRTMTAGFRAKIGWKPMDPARRILGFAAALIGHFAPVASAFEAELDHFEGPPDVVHCCDLDTLLVGIRAKQRYGCRIVYDAHEYWPESDPESSAWERRLYRLYERLLVRQADDVVTVSPPLARHFEHEYGIGPVLSVPNAAPWLPSSTDASAASHDPPAAAGKIKVLFQGGFAPMRGIEALLHAWAALRPAHACLILRGPDNHFKDEYRQLAARLGLLDRDVFFPPPVDASLLIDAAKSADIGVIPYVADILNHRLCCPNKLSQYMHAGLMLVVSADLLFVRDIVKSAQAGIAYDPARVENLVDALRTAVTDAELRARCRAGALRFSASSFNWQRVAAPLMALYRQTPSGTSRAPGAGTWRTPRRRTALVLYYTRGVYPLRNTIRAHLYCWRSYLQSRVVYANVAFGFPARTVRRLDPDAVIFDTTFLSMRWTPSIFREFTQKCRALKTFACVKAIVPQDEYMQTRLLGEFVNEFGITHILTNAEPSDWPTIYPNVSRDKVAFRTVLTGYVDPRTLAGINRKLALDAPRPIDVGYRAWRAEYWLGEHATHKVRVAEVIGPAAEAAGLNTDISLREEDVIAGDAWLDFLLRCRATIGVEGGARVLDEDGEIKRRVNEYLRRNPQASFEETRDACFPDAEGRISLVVITPRHLEACATRTCQLLVQGQYNGIMQPWRHYVPIAPDYSNVEEALALLADAQRVEEIVDRAYEEVACNDRLTYRAFVGEIERSIIDAGAQRAAQHAPWTRAWARACLDVSDWFNWQFIRFECWILRRNIPPVRMARRIYHVLRRRQGEF